MMALRLPLPVGLPRITLASSSMSSSEPPFYRMRRRGLYRARPGGGRAACSHLAHHGRQRAELHRLRGWTNNLLGPSACLEGAQELSGGSGRGDRPTLSAVGRCFHQSSCILTKEHISMTIPNILSLDFDGVLCDGMREYFETTRRTYVKIWPTDPEPGEDLFPAFRTLRPVIMTGWEMPILLRAIVQGRPVASIAMQWAKVRDALVSEGPLH